MGESKWMGMRCPEEAFDLRWDLASERKWRLIAIACCRRIWHLGTDSARSIVERAERLADGQEGLEDGADGRLLQMSGFLTGPARYFALAARWCVEVDPQKCLFGAADDARRAVRASRPQPIVEEFETPGPEGLAQVKLLRDVIGDPFLPVAFNPAWRTDTALLLARQMYESRDFGAMPILADALQDAGCDHEEILAHCRSEGPHVRGCWVVDLVLGKE